MSDSRNLIDNLSKYNSTLMAVSESYLTFVVDQLEPHFTIRTKKMFGGVGVYADDLFFALMDDDRLYFKVDDINRPDFEEAGMDAFHPYGDERSMNYWEVPAHVLEDSDALAEWATKAIEVARRAKK
jgi:DNA transformation protein